MTRFYSKARPLLRRPRALVLTLAALAAAVWAAGGRAQIPINPDHDFVLVVYDAGEEVGRVYRDAAGPVYTEHWVLFPNYRFDQIRGPGGSIEIVAEPGPGYRSAREFLASVPFPEGSRYVIAACQEFDRLP